MRESQMKKIIALAVASAFVAPVMAADVSISGLSEFTFKDANGTTTADFTDNAIYVGASTETANGLTVTAAMNITGAGADDGSDALTVSGPFGEVTMGDVSGATDKFDQRTDKDVGIGVSTSGYDAAAGWTLPTIVEGLTVYASYAAENNNDGGTASAQEGSGLALQYVAGPVSVAYATVDTQDATKEQDYVGATVSMNGLAVSAEVKSTGASGAKEDITGIGVSYAMGDLTLNAVSSKTEDSSNVTTSDVTFYGVQYNLGGGVKVFAEVKSDDKNTDADVSGFGVAFAF
jgi:hypothetical protein